MDYRCFISQGLMVFFFVFVKGVKLLINMNIFSSNTISVLAVLTIWYLFCHSLFSLTSDLPALSTLSLCDCRAVFHKMVFIIIIASRISLRATV